VVRAKSFHSNLRKAPYSVPFPERDNRSQNSARARRSSASRARKLVRREARAGQRLSARSMILPTT
jgi:hypothetical protein